MIPVDAASMYYNGSVYWKKRARGDGEQWRLAPRPVPLQVSCDGCVDQSHLGRSECTLPVWSPRTGAVTVGGDFAFNIEPTTGTLRGTPQVLIASYADRAFADITCRVAAGGGLYGDKVLVTEVTVRIQDNTCWVPMGCWGKANKNVTFGFPLKAVNAKVEFSTLSAAKQECTKRGGACAGVVQSPAVTGNYSLRGNSFGAQPQPGVVSWAKSCKQEPMYLATEPTLMNMAEEKVRSAMDAKSMVDAALEAGKKAAAFGKVHGWSEDLVAKAAGMATERAGGTLADVARSMGDNAAGALTGFLNGLTVHAAVTELAEGYGMAAVPVPILRLLHEDVHYFPEESMTPFRQKDMDDVDRLVGVLNRRGNTSAAGRAAQRFLMELIDPPPQVNDSFFVEGLPQNSSDPDVTFLLALSADSRLFSRNAENGQWGPISKAANAVKGAVTTVVKAAAPAISKVKSVAAKVSAAVGVLADSPLFAIAKQGFEIAQKISDNPMIKTLNTFAKASIPGYALATQAVSLAKVAYAQAQVFMEHGDFSSFGGIMNGLKGMAMEKLCPKTCDGSMHEDRWEGNCRQYVSKSGLCGGSDDHKNGGTDCRKCILEMLDPKAVAKSAYDAAMAAGLSSGYPFASVLKSAKRAAGMAGLEVEDLSMKKFDVGSLAKKAFDAAAKFGGSPEDILKAAANMAGSMAESMGLNLPDVAEITGIVSEFAEKLDVTKVIKRVIPNADNLKGLATTLVGTVKGFGLDPSKLLSAATDAVTAFGIAENFPIGRLMEVAVDAAKNVGATMIDSFKSALSAAAKAVVAKVGAFLPDSIKEVYASLKEFFGNNEKEVSQIFPPVCLAAGDKLDKDEEEVTLELCKTFYRACTGSSWNRQGWCSQREWTLNSVGRLKSGHDDRCLVATDEKVYMTRCADGVPVGRGAVAEWFLDAGTLRAVDRPDQCLQYEAKGLALKSCGSNLDDTNKWFFDSQNELVDAGTFTTLMQEGNDAKTSCATQCKIKADCGGFWEEMVHNTTRCRLQSSTGKIARTTQFYSKVSCQESSTCLEVRIEKYESFSGKYCPKTTPDDRWYYMKADPSFLDQAYLLKEACPYGNDQGKLSYVVRRASAEKDFAPENGGPLEFYGELIACLPILTVSDAFARGRSDSVAQLKAPDQSQESLLMVNAYPEVQLDTAKIRPVDLLELRQGGLADEVVDTDSDLGVRGWRRRRRSRRRRTPAPSPSPTESPTFSPTDSPTDSPSDSPTLSPTDSPTMSPTDSPTPSPTLSPTDSPTPSPTMSPERLASVAIVPTECAAPERLDSNIQFGTTDDPDLYTLDPCECFGKAHSDSEPVSEDAANEVPDSGVFNEYIPPPQLLFSAPYMCDEAASITGEQKEDVSFDACFNFCLTMDVCHFFIYSFEQRFCLPMKHCKTIVETGLPFANDLYGVLRTPQCRVADSEACWLKRRRREVLAGVRSPTEIMESADRKSSLERCAFESVLALCDLLQMSTGVANGRCGQCMYHEPSTSHVASAGRAKLPLPASFKAASQLRASCADGTRGMRLSTSQKTDGVIMTCVDGAWRDRYMNEGIADFVCHECVQVGSPALKEYLAKGAPEIYFIEKRDFKYHYGWDGKGCATTSAMSPAPLRMSLSHKNYCFTSTGGLNTTCTDQFYFQDGRIVLASKNSFQCLVYDKAFNVVALQPCVGREWTRDGHLFKTIDGRNCLTGKTNGEATIARCTQEATQMWTFMGGDCVLQLELASLSMPLIWLHKLGNVGYLGHDTQEEQPMSLSVAQKRINTTNTLFCRVSVVAKPQFVHSHYRGGGMSRDINLTNLSAPAAKFIDSLMLTTAPAVDSACRWRAMIGNCDNMTRASKNDAYCDKNLTKGDMGYCDCNGDEHPDPSERYFDCKASKYPANCAKVCGRNAAFSSCVPGSAGGSAALVQVEQQMADVLASMSSFQNSGSGSLDEVDCDAITHNGQITRHIQYSMDRDFDGQCDTAEVASGFDIDEESYNLYCSWSQDAKLSDCAWEQLDVPANANVKDPRTGRAGERQVPGVEYADELRVIHGLRQVEGRLSVQTCVIQGSKFVNEQRHDWGVPVSKRESVAILTGIVVSSYSIRPKEDNKWWTSATATICRDLSAEEQATMFEFQSLLKQRDHLIGGTTCMSEATMSVDDFQGLRVGYTMKEALKKIDVDATAECARLHDGAAAGGGGGSKQDGPKVQLSSEQAMILLRENKYRMVAAVRPDEAPFNSRAGTVTDSAKIGYMAMLDDGSTLWGIDCPPGAVVAYTVAVDGPHCIHVGATDEDEVVGSMPDSAVCDMGSAVAGWYNAPNKNVWQSTEGGPIDPTFFKLKCRKIIGMSRTCEKSEGTCSQGSVLGGIMYNDKGKVSYMCCRVPRPIGVAPLSTTLKGMEPWEGYYCPTRLDESGRPVYQESTTVAGDTEARGSLRWNMETGSWNLFWEGYSVAAVVSDAMLPTEIDQASTFGVARVVDLSASFVSSVEKQNKQSKQERKPPTLRKSAPETAQYDEYCKDSVRNIAPGLSGETSQGHPCHHVQENKLTDHVVWQCGNEESATNYIKAQLDAKFQRAEAARAKSLALGHLIFLASQLVAGGAVSWIPGSYSDVAEKVVNNAEVIVEGVLRSGGLPSELTDHTKVVEERSNILNSLGTDSAEMQRAKQTMLESMGRNEELASSNGNSDYDSETGAFSGADAIPELAQPGTWGSGMETNMLTFSEGSNCDSVKFGLSKIICDLYCVNDAVREGDKSILATIKSQSDALTENLKLLFEYYTGTVLDRADAMEKTLKASMLPSQKLLAGPTLLRRGDVDAREMLSALSELPSVVQGLSTQASALQDAPRVDRDLVAWHQETGSALLRRVAAALANNRTQQGGVSVERAVAAQEAVRQFDAAFQARTKAKSTVEQAASVQTRDRAKILSRRVEDNRMRLNNVRSLLDDMRGGLKLSVNAPTQIAARWSQLIAVFLPVHEKHTYFVETKNRALDLHDELIDDVKAYTGCATTLQELHSRWERAMAAESRATEVLLEAWAATQIAEEQIQNAILDGLPEHMVLAAVRNNFEESSRPCGSLLEVASDMHKRTVMVADRALLPLVQQLNAFEAIAKQQQENIDELRLRASKRNGLMDALGNLHRITEEIAWPNGTLATELVVEALANQGGASPCPRAGADRQANATNSGIMTQLRAWASAPLKVLGSFLPGQSSPGAVAPGNSDAQPCDRICYRKLASRLPKTKGIMQPIIGFLSNQEQKKLNGGAETVRE
eukprot:TRINITY_DN2086_c0_g1_i3.p1 TRINITY_DN2086_c0_g1~~TRINITY_DN2086_c0_g1_i3.p1  ORF type:complete len:3588 (+),score=627.02 TRINITY_DN2086_c0_g1_i3:1023-10766(+)